MEGNIIIQKREGEFLVLRVASYRGHPFADISVHITKNGYCGPSKKGITVGPALWPAFRRGVLELKNQLIDAGLLDEADISEGNDGRQRERGPER